MRSICLAAAAVKDSSKSLEFISLMLTARFNYMILKILLPSVMKSNQVLSQLTPPMVNNVYCVSSCPLLYYKIVFSTMFAQ